MDFRELDKDYLLATIAVGLAVLAAYNFAVGAYGGAVISGIGTILTTLFLILTP